jgi:tetratricopeptide (TPR) repeat protein
VLRGILCISLFVAWHAALTSAQPTFVSDFPPLDHSIVITLDRDGGRTLVDALQHLPPRASALEVLLRHGYINESLKVFSRIVDADGPELLDGLKAANSVSRWWDDQRLRAEVNTALAGIAEHALAAASRRPREEAAAIVRQVLWVQANIAPRYSRDIWAASLRGFVATYDGTATARFAEVELLMESLPGAQKAAVLERYAREHEGTLAGARALYEAAFQRGVNHAVTGIDPRGSDPTDRLSGVAALARELESGRYPQVEWVARAPTLVTGFFVSDSPAPPYAPGNLQRSLDVYGDFVRAHLTWPDPYPPNDSLGFMVSWYMWRLWALQGDPKASADRFFDGLAADPAERARFLQARTYLNRARNEPKTGSALRERAIELLDELARDGSDRVRRTAHAMLASEVFANGDDQRACAEFRRFIAAYPRSDWTWVASLRVGQCEEALQHWQIAAEAYRRASTMHAGTPAAVLLGHAYAARALEGVGDFNAALNEYRQANAAWFGSESQRYELSIWRRRPSAQPGAPFGYDATLVTKPELESRRTQLSATLAASGGALLERARWALGRGARNDARGLVSQLLAQVPRSPLVREARRLAHEADFEDALDLAAPDNPRDVAGAKQRLETLSREPADVVVSVAKFARASLMTIEGAPGNDALAKEALDDWLKLQTALPPAAPGSLDADADAVRRAVFRPLGGSYGRHYAQEWPRALPPFLIAPATLPVQESNGRVRMLSASRPLPGLENTLYLSEQDFGLLRRTIAILGGSLRYVSASVMATPNQPAGASQTIVKFWNRFFPMRPGHWGGWDFASYPVITTIEFMNRERTKASVPVIIGYSGGTVLLEKIDGEWRVLDMVNKWDM